MHLVKCSEKHVCPRYKFSAIRRASDIQLTPFAHVQNIFAAVIDFRPFVERENARDGICDNLRRKYRAQANILKKAFGQHNFPLRGVIVRNNGDTSTEYYTIP